MPGSKGRARFVQRVWRLASTRHPTKAMTRSSSASSTARSRGQRGNLDGLQFNKAVAQLYELVSAIEKASRPTTRSRSIALSSSWSPLLLRISRRKPGPLLGEAGMVVDAAWPSFDPAMLVEDEVTLAIQVNGKLRDTFNAPRGLDRGGCRGARARVREGAAPARQGNAPER